MSLLLGRGADINTVGSKYGSALGVAAYMGYENIVSLPLGRGANVTFVGGRYKTWDGEYPTTLHTALSGHATSSLLALVRGALNREFQAMEEAADLAHRPPFPMSYTPTRTESIEIFFGISPTSELQLVEPRLHLHSLSSTRFPCGGQHCPRAS